MAITITNIVAPVNLASTVSSGGSLAASTTYYVIVVAKNDNRTYNVDNTSLTSPISDEISFVTTSTDKTATITWDAVTGATNYNVYLTTVSGEYQANYHSLGLVTTNSIVITAVPTVAGIYQSEIFVNTINMPYLLSKTSGIIQVVISGTETLQTINDAIVAAGFQDNVYYDGFNNFALRGSITINSGSTGSLTILRHNLTFIQGFFRNASTSFTLTLGAYDSNTTVTSSGCVIQAMFGIIVLTNINVYAAQFRFATLTYVDYTGRNYIGSDITMGTNVLDCTFDAIRNTNTNWSNNKLTNPSMLRAWNILTIRNAYYDSAVYISYYPPNSANTFYDCTFKLSNTSYAIQMAGYNSNSYPSAKLYDVTFVGTVYPTVNDLVFNFAAYVGLAGFDFYYSINGNVLDEEQNLLDGVNIKGYDKNNTEIFDINTSSGVIPQTYIRVLNVLPTGNGTGTSYYTKTSYSPFTFVFSKAGYETYTTTYDVINKITKNITLKAVKKIRPTVDGNFLIANQPELGSRSILVENII